MGYTFVKPQDAYNLASYLKSRNVPEGEWKTTLPKLANKLESIRFNKKPETYKKIYSAASEAGPITKVLMGIYGSNLVKTFTAGVQTMAPHSWYGQASHAIEDVLASGKAVPETAVGRFFGRSLLPLMADAPVFSALGAAGAATGTGAIGTLMMYSAEGQAADIIAGRQKTFNFKSLAKAGLLGGVFFGMGKLVGHVPYLRQLSPPSALAVKGRRVTKFWEKVNARYPDFSKVAPDIAKKLSKQAKRLTALDTREFASMTQLTPSGGIASRVGKRLLSSGLRAVPASFVSPAVELFDPTTNQKWDIKDFANTWALYASMDIMGIIKAGQWGAMESRLKQQGIDPKQATVLTNLAQVKPMASIQQVFSLLKHNKASVKNAADVWKSWQIEQGTKGKFGVKVQLNIRKTLRTAEDEQKRLYEEYAVPMPSPAERLASALEIYTKTKKPAFHPGAKARMLKQAKLLRDYKGNIFDLDNEGLRGVIGMATQKRSVENARIKLLPKLKVKTIDELKAFAKTRGVSLKNKTPQRLMAEILMTEKGKKPGKSKTVDTLMRQIRRIEKKPIAPKYLPEGAKIEPATHARWFSDPRRFFYAKKAGDVIEPGYQARVKMTLEASYIKNWLTTTAADLHRLTHTSVSEINKARLRNKPTKAQYKLAKFLNEERPDFRNVPAELRQIYKDCRYLSDNMRKRANVVLKFLDMKDKNGKPMEIKNLPGYLTRLLDVQARAAKGEHPFNPNLEYWIRRISPDDIHNFTRLHRTLKTKEFEGLLMNPFQCLNALVAADLKTIYLQVPSVLFKQQINNLAGREILPANMRKALKSWMDIAIKGYPAPSDKMTDATLAQLKVPAFMNKVLAPFGRTWGDRSIKNISDDLGQIIHLSTIWGRVKLPVRNHTQKLLALGLTDTYSFIKATGPAPPECLRIIQNSDFYNISRVAYMESIPTSVLGAAKKAGFDWYGRSHVSNVTHTMKAMWHSCHRLARSKNPTFRAFWQDVIKHENKLKMEMEWGADSCQYAYFKQSVPELYQSKTASIFAKLQSWPMNYAFKYHRELLHRLATGRPGWAGKGPSVLPWSLRLGSVRHLVSSAIFIEALRKGLGLDYSKIAGLGVLPTQLSPTGQFMTGLVQWAGADTEWEKENAKRKMGNTIGAFVPTSGAARDLTRFLTGEATLGETVFYQEK